MQWKTAKGRSQGLEGVFEEFNSACCKLLFTLTDVAQPKHAISRRLEANLILLS